MTICQQKYSKKFSLDYRLPNFNNVTKCLRFWHRLLALNQFVNNLARKVKLLSLKEVYDYEGV